jgi:ABC-type antimicrobial peptide transport system permease subunit
MKGENISSPPKWADRFLEWYCNPKILEQIQGDVHELYHWRVEKKGNKNANTAFIWDVMRFFRWRNIKNSNTQKQQFNNTAMFKNYMKIGWRNLTNQKVPSLINIFGLSCAIACCLVAYLFIEGIWFKGMYHENKEEIYMVTHTGGGNDAIQRYGYTSSPMANIIESEFPAVKSAVRVERITGIVKYKNETFSERIYYVDTDFKDMFTYPIVYGSLETLKDLDKVVITENVSQKLFGTTHPIGQEVTMSINGEQKIMTIGCVVETLPSTAMFRFGVLLNYQHLALAAAKYSLNDKWKEQPWLFLQVQDKEQLSNVIAGFDRLISLQNEARPDRKYLELQLEPFTTIVQNSSEIEGGLGTFGGLAPQILLSMIAIFMLTLAIFNYVNIAILMAKKRIKEIGVRKAIGGRRGQLIFQFLSENLITCFLAIVLGGIIASTLFLPWFNELARKNLAIDLLNNTNLWMFFGTLLIFITVASGAYPAFYISSFKPSVIFRGTEGLGNKSRFTGGLLVFQFALAMITIVAGLSIIQTNTDNFKRDWGYNKESKIFVNTPSKESYFRIKDVLSQQSNIIEMTGSRHHVGQNIADDIATVAGEDYDVITIYAEANYGEVMDLRLMKGRLFNTDLAGDNIASIVVNQTFIDQLDLSFPTEELITMDSIKYNIIGLVEDFHYSNFAFSINPVAILTMPDSNYNYLTVKVEPGSTAEMAEVVKEIWHEEIEGELYYGGAQSDVFEMYFSDMIGLRNVLLFTAILAVILSAMGLFGLVSLNLSSKMKDFGIQKILGANMVQLSKNVYKRFLILLVIGCLIGGGGALFVISALLDSIYAFHSSIGALSLIMGVFILLVVMIITITSQFVKVKKANPVDTLRME